MEVWLSLLWGLGTGLAIGIGVTGFFYERHCKTLMRSFYGLHQRCNSLERRHEALITANNSYMAQFADRDGTIMIRLGLN